MSETNLERRIRRTKEANGIAQCFVPGTRIERNEPRLLVHRRVSGKRVTYVVSPFPESIHHHLRKTFILRRIAARALANLIHWIEDRSRPGIEWWEDTVRSHPDFDQTGLLLDWLRSTDYDEALHCETTTRIPPLLDLPRDGSLTVQPEPRHRERTRLPLQEVPQAPVRGEVRRAAAGAQQELVSTEQASTPEVLARSLP